MNSVDISLIAVPNVSAGRDLRFVRRLRATTEGHGAHVLDVHSDATHDRSVLTVGGRTSETIAGLTDLALAATAIDLREQMGVHPRLGGLDVCPLVPFGTGAMAEVVAAATELAEAIAASGIPVFLYGRAARREEARELSDLRRGGLARLIERAKEELPPDLGPRKIDPSVGVVCVGARSVLIAFNVWLRGPVSSARRIARSIRERDGGLPGVKALGLDIGDGKVQVSMNLTRPIDCGVDTAFETVAGHASRLGLDVIGTELVGLPPQRFMPDPDAQAARLSIQPGRSLETVLEEICSSRAD